MGILLRIALLLLLASPAAAQISGGGGAGGGGAGGTPLPAGAPLIGTNGLGVAQQINLGTNLSLNTGVTPWVLSATGGGGGGVGGSGTVGFVPLWAGTTTLGNGLPVGTSGASSILETMPSGFLSTSVLNAIPSTSMANTGVGAGTYTNLTSITVDQAGRIGGITFGTGLLGPVSSVTGDLLIFNGTSGNNAADSGILSTNVATLPGTQTFSGSKNFTGGLQIGGAALTLPVTAANGGTGLTALSSGVIYRGNGTSAMQSTALSDNGTVVSTAEPFDLTSQSALIEIPNAAATGTTNGFLAKLTGAPATAVRTTTSDNDGAIGIVVGGGGTTGNAQIAAYGQASCTFDGAASAGDFVSISASVAGNCHDAGATRPSGIQVIGRVMATIGGAGSATVALDKGFSNTSGAGAGNVTASGTATNGNIPTWTGSFSLSSTGLPVGTTGNNTVVQTDGSGHVANSLISGLPNANLANSSMTIAGHSVALGGTTAIAATDLSNETANTILGNNTGSPAAPAYLTPAQVSTMLSLGTMATQNASAVSISGGTITGTAVTGLATPVGSSDAASKGYVDGAVTGAVLHTQVAAATAAVLPNTPTASGTGVGKTLTSATNTALVVDGYSVLLNDRILVKNQVAGADNGIYTETQVGTGSVPWILTRATDFDQASAGEVALGAYMFVTGGTVNVGTQWQLGAPTPASITVDTTALTFNKLNAATVYTADGTTLSLTGNQFSALPNGILSAVTATPNSLLARGASTWAGVAPVNNAVLVTSGSGVPSESATLPSGLTIPGYLTGNQTVTLSGDTTGSGATAITTTTGKVNGVTYPSAPSTNTAPIVTGSNTITYEQVPTAAIANSAVTYGKIQNEAAGTLLGNSTGSPAAPAEISIGHSLAVSSSTIDQSLPVQAAKTANYSVLYSGSSFSTGTDDYTVIPFNCAGACTATMPQSTASVFPPGHLVCFANRSTSNLTISATTSTINASAPLTTGSVVLPQYGDVCLKADASNNYEPMHYAAPTVSGAGNVTTTGGVTGQLAVFSGSTAINTSQPFGTTGNNTVVETSGAGVISNTLVSGLPFANLATMTDGTLLANISGSPAVPVASSLSLILDHDIGATQGSIAYRNATTWVPLAPGTAGQFLTTGGAAANPSWSLAPVNNNLVVGSGGAWSSLATANNSVLCTSAAGVPSLCTTLPSGLTIPGFVTSIVAGTPNLVIGGTAAVPSISLTVPFDTQAGNSVFAIPASDNTKVLFRTNTSSQTDTIAQAGTTGFGAGWGVTYLSNNVGNNITPTTSTIGGLSTIHLGAHQMADLVSDGTNYQVALGLPVPVSQPGTTFLRDDFVWTTPPSASLTLSGVVTGSGTLPLITTSYPNQSANQVLAGPTTGSAAAPTFRTLVPADLTSPLTTPPPIGGTTPAAVSSTTLAVNSTVTLTGLTTGTQTVCLGLNASNQVVLSTGACGGGGGGQNGYAVALAATAAAGSHGGL